jgi:hemoglobin/transferrin/lactoferrin receptor protein
MHKTIPIPKYAMTAPLLALLLIPFPSALASSASNATAQTAITLPTMVVSASRDGFSENDAPYALSTISANRLRLAQAPRTVPEALKFEPGTMVQKTAHGQGSPYIRGFTSQRNLLMIDGVRLNNSVFRDGPNQYWNTVDALGLDRIDIARGPFSVLYGSDAIGGTVNAFTRGLQNLEPGSDWDRNVYYRYGSAENAHSARFESIGKLTDNLFMSLGLSVKDFGDLEGGKQVGTQEKTGYDERDWDAKLEYFAGNDTTLVFAHQNVDINDAWRTHKTIFGTDWKGLSVGKELRRALDQNRELTYLQVHKHNADGFAEEIHAGLSHQLQTEKQDRLRSGERRDVQGFDVHTAGAFLTLKSPTPFGRLTYGGEFYHDDVDSFRQTLNADGSIKSAAIQGPVGDDATYDTLGIFLQDEIPLRDRLTLILGTRYEYAQADADTVQDPLTGDTISVSDDWDDIVGSARVRYALDDDNAYRVFAGISQGFRAPNLSDLTRLDSARTDEIETPAPGLDSEHFVSYELGLKAETDGLTAQLTYFYTDIDGMVVRTPTGRIIDGDSEVTKRNAGDGFIHGVELETQYALGYGITALGGFTWMDGEVDTYATSDALQTTETIDRLMPPTGRAGLRWDHPDHVWLEASCTIAAKADKLSTRDKSDTSRIPPGGTPGYSVYDLRAGWACTDRLSFSIALENIADEDYRVHGSGLNEPGRNLILAVQSSF